MSDTDREAVTAGLAANTLNWFRSTEGYPGGHCFEAHLDLLAELDTATIDRHAEGFPAVVFAFRLARTTGGLDVLRGIMAGVNA